VETEFHKFRRGLDQAERIRLQVGIISNHFEFNQARLK
jgi:hypothetical protein